MYMLLIDTILHFVKFLLVTAVTLTMLFGWLAFIGIHTWWRRRPAEQTTTVAVVADAPEAERHRQEFAESLQKAREEREAYPNEPEPGTFEEAAFIYRHIEELGGGQVLPECEYIHVHPGDAVLSPRMQQLVKEARPYIVQAHRKNKMELEERRAREERIRQQREAEYREQQTRRQQEMLRPTSQQTPYPPITPTQVNQTPVPRFRQTRVAEQIVEPNRVTTRLTEIVEEY